MGDVCLGAGSALDRVVERGVLKVAMSGEQQPFSFVYGKKKSLIGFDVDLAREIAKLMNVELDVVRVPFEELMVIPEITASALPATPRRRVALAEPGDARGAVAVSSCLTATCWHAR